jgi:phosphate acyltransferase
VTHPAVGRVAPAHRRSPGAPPRPAADPGDAAAAVSTVRIAVDLLGGDQAPDVVVGGALQACGSDPGLHLLLVGPPEVTDAAVRALDRDTRDRLDVRTAARVASPTAAVGRNPDTTVRAAVRAVTEGYADAVVSAGPTGATVTAAALGFGRWPGVRRPALVVTLPTLTGRPVVLLDVGASVDAAPATLAGHAVLGAAYRSITGAGGGRVGLLSIGTETGKGDRVRRAADPLLAGLSLPGGATYVGLVEGHDVVLGERADVVVTDGFTGNVLLKGLEGAYDLVRDRLPGEHPPRAAVLLGVAGTAVVCHGAAGPADVASGIGLAADLHRTAALGALAALLPWAAPPPPPTSEVPHD